MAFAQRAESALSSNEHQWFGLKECLVHSLGKGQKYRVVRIGGTQFLNVKPSLNHYNLQ